MEVLYRVWRDESKADGQLAYEQCLALPITWVHETPELLVAAAEVKAHYPLSLADAWIAAAAQLSGARCWFTKTLSFLRCLLRRNCCRLKL